MLLLFICKTSFDINLILCSLDVATIVVNQDKFGVVFCFASTFISLFFNPFQLVSEHELCRLEIGVEFPGRWRI